MMELEQRLENAPLVIRTRNYEILAETPFAVAQTQFCGHSLNASVVIVAILAFIIIALPFLIFSAALFATCMTGLGPLEYNITTVEVEKYQGVSIKTIVVPIPFQFTGAYIFFGILMLVCGAFVSAVIVVTVVGGFQDKPPLFLCWFKSEWVLGLLIMPIKIIGGILLWKWLKSQVPLVLLPIVFISDVTIYMFMAVMVGKLTAVNRNNRFKRCMDVSTTYVGRGIP